MKMGGTTACISMMRLRSILTVLLLLAVGLAHSVDYGNYGNYGGNYPGASYDNYCYAHDQDPYLKFATKTAYDFARGQRGFETPKGCRAAQIWVLARHGTRYPGEKTIENLNRLRLTRDQIIQNIEISRKGQLCRADQALLKNWVVNRDLNQPSQIEALTASGRQEIMMLARRLQAAYPEIMTLSQENFSYKDHVFVSTNTKRTRASLEAFAEGMARYWNQKPPYFAQSNETLLKLYDHCPSYKASLKSEQVSHEANEFKETPVYKDLMRNVSHRLGYSYIIGDDMIQSMYDACRFDKAWNPNAISPWCVVFNKEELKVLEYLMDLEDYYEIGPGRRENERLSCLLLQDLFDRFSNLEDRHRFQSEPKGVFYFAHTKTIQPVLTALGINTRDHVPLQAWNYNQMRNRVYRTSNFNSFASNLIAIFFQCDDIQAPHKVMFYASENRVDMEGCNLGLCNWEDLKRRFAHKAQFCDVDEICRDPNGAPRIGEYGTRMVAAAVGIIFLIHKHMMVSV